jgi:hypothetical protein
MSHKVRNITVELSEPAVDVVPAWSWPSVI